MIKLCLVWGSLILPLLFSPVVKIDSPEKNKKEIRQPRRIYLNHTASMKPENALRFNHTTVYVEDLKTSTQFYTEVMTLSPIPEPFHDHRHSWFHIGDHGQLHVVQGAQQKTAHDINIHLAFTVQDLPAFIEHLKAAQVPFGAFDGTSGKPVKRPDGVEQIYFQDPDGYWIEVNNDRN